ncbi:uncharacterized protein LOC133183901 [Saccostrea echinata]|uniref:uncharacterized protein LOC133183901 n=1 Tax=Saccostrea echinata TaxID=191078 RepID=UPI002A8233A0|nr:uncharacterized protein LOC133183901 [Saccostrea echinata]
MSLDRLEQLRNGRSKDLDIFPDPEKVPVDLDMQRFNNGRKFFQDNVSMCVLGMFCSLVAGFSVVNLLEPLVFTNKSNTAKKSLNRYLDTVRHVALWHYGDIWDPLSLARKSIKKVYDMHTHARDSMKKANKTNRHFTQYDMSLVQAGFIGFIIMYPDRLGLRGSRSHLDDFVYFWRWIGFFSGIRDENNICINGFEDAYQICKQVEDEIVYPALFNPPDHFNSMAKAFTEGLSLLTNVTLYTPESVIGFSLDMARKKRIKDVDFLDSCRIIYLKIIVILVKYCSCFRSMANRLTESLIVPNKFIF